jgi:hypothetical protein
MLEYFFSLCISFATYCDLELTCNAQVYETILYLLTPFILPVSLIVQPWFCVGMSFGILGLYLLQVIIFNEIHLRRKGERVSMWTVVGFYVR